MNTDVVIVGGGLSGLSLADRLQRRGVDFQLLEGRDRLGGRILTRTIGSGAFDLGPAWFWPGQPHMAALVDRLGLEPFEQYALGDTVSEDEAGGVRRGAGFAPMRGSLRVSGGLRRVIEGLAAGVPAANVRLAAQVRAVTRMTGRIGVTATTAAGPMAIEAQRVVFAAPPRIVEKLVRFDPLLPPTSSQALRAIPTWMAGQAKVLAVYDQPHWRHAGFSGHAFSWGGPLIEVHDASPRRGGPYALFGFVGASADVRLRHRRELLELSRRQLGRLFGEAMLSPRELVLEDWSQQAYTATPLDHVQSGAHPAYGRPASLEGLWDGRLHFAGTEMAPSAGGLLEGALEASAEAFD
jgi:monoamine oxidase